MSLNPFNSVGISLQQGYPNMQFINKYLLSTYYIICQALSQVLRVQQRISRQNSLLLWR